MGMIPLSREKVTKIATLEGLDPRTCNFLGGYYDDKADKCFIDYEETGEDAIKIRRLEVEKAFEKIEKE